MDRIKEIKIILEYLENNTKMIGNKYPEIFSDTIIKNGKLIEKYTKELDELYLLNSKK